MDETITSLEDPETPRILRTRRKRTKSAVTKNALRDACNSETNEAPPTAWAVYSELCQKLGPAPPGPKVDRARNVSRLLKEILEAKRRAATL